MTEALYLQALFAASPRGEPAAEIAQRLGVSTEEAEQTLLGLWRRQLAARLPNPRGHGFLWRTKLRGDLQAGFLFELDDEPYRVVNGTPSREEQKRRATRTRLVIE